jgi:hypothetical protein
MVMELTATHKSPYTKAVQVKPDTHRKLKIMASVGGVTISSLADQILSDWLEANPVVQGINYGKPDE